MLNVGGGEFLVILLVALIVLGPKKLPEAARQVAAVGRELRRISAGFQRELKAAMDDPIEAAARERGHKVTSSEQRPAPTEPATPIEADSPAGRVGMYDIASGTDHDATATDHHPTTTDHDSTDQDPAATDVAPTVTGPADTRPDDTAPTHTAPVADPPGPAVDADDRGIEVDE